MTTAALPILQDTRGPATETIVGAYRRVAYLERFLVANHQVPNPRVRDALGFLLHHTTRVSSQPAGTIDCARCLLYISARLRNASDEFIAAYDQLFWSTCGAVAGQIRSRVGQPQVEIAPTAASGWFLERFNGAAETDLRSRIVYGFAEVAGTAMQRDKRFWETVDAFGSFAARSTRDETKPLADRRAIVGPVVHIWWKLAHKFGTDRQVREKLTSRAELLFDLIVAAAQPEPLNEWVQMLTNLGLPSRDPWQEEEVPFERRDFQPALDVAARSVDRLWRESGETSIWKSKLRDSRPQLVPYLHGRRPRHDRRVPTDLPSSQIRVWFRSAHDERLVDDARLLDICSTTGRGLAIEVQQLDIPFAAEHKTGLCGRRVEAEILDHETVSGRVKIESVAVELSYPLLGKRQAFRLDCEVVRTWPLENGGSGWALRASPAADLPAEWTSYVQDLPTR